MSPALLSRPLVGLVSSLCLLVGCGEGKDPLDTIGHITASAGPTSNGNPSGNPSGGDPSGDPSTDSTDGGTESASATETGGPTEATTNSGGEHGDCPQYILCVVAINPDSQAEVEMAYGPEGTCWTTPELTQECLSACSSGLANFGALFPDVPECGGSGSTSTTDVSTTGPLTTTDWPGTSDPGTTFGTTEPETTGGEYGNCGWDAGNAYYGCGGVGPDPDGVNPIDCPPDVAVGDPCSPDTPVNGIGCCMPNGDNYYCGNDNMVYMDACG
ncbi:hypothetical protein [Nannocystis punicea]|uniref:Kazal-like domain-containing protein n=1 Tax=Nannocystis punicea TaxID=2995304 RepID=A0ABY7H035_9BACT|nr:hypothetical protein [Nannocystis poenicansa]WAS92608.1 hypothetical protein O0S08_41040 [Nannocystis poenicansa]